MPDRKRDRSTGAPGEDGGAPAHPSPSHSPPDKRPRTDDGANASAGDQPVAAAAAAAAAPSASSLPPTGGGGNVPIDAALAEEVASRRERALAWQRQQAAEAEAGPSGEAPGPPPPGVAAPAPPPAGSGDDDDDGDAAPLDDAAEAARLRQDLADRRAAAEEGGEAGGSALGSSGGGGGGGGGAAPGAPPGGPPAAALSDDGEVDPLDAFMAANDADAAAAEAEAAAAEAARRAAAAVPATAAAAAAPAPPGSAHPPPPPLARRRAGRYFSGASTSSGDAPDSDASDAAGGKGGEEEEDMDDAAWAKAVTLGRLTKGDRLAALAGAALPTDWPPFRRAFYIAVPDLARLTPAEVAARRAAADGTAVRGRDVPAPLSTWAQAGLSSRTLEALRRAGLDAPTPVQAQALPCIMAGRDTLAIAKTGSGKTLAYVLPALRHIRDQAPLAQGDGPIALILAPTRELVVQIGREVKRFGGATGVRCVCAYGGSALGSQIADLKRGAEVVAATPGRLIDVLGMSGGRITNLRRVTYLALDEADRMFDLGFGPQLGRVTGLVRPDRQAVLFSATFPRGLEALAKQLLLHAPVEVQVGGRSVVNADIAQVVEVRPPGERFLRLLEILGEWCERGKVLVFTSSQAACDSLFRDLLSLGWPCLSLHGGKDQADRASTIADFKGDVCNLLVATSVAARGLDVKGVALVVNYDPPSHHEDYIHRVGRTGQAGAKGTAITFIAPGGEEEKAAPDLVRALVEAGAPVPRDLAAIAAALAARRAAAGARTAAPRRGGFGGHGFKFDAAEAAAEKAGRTAAARAARRAAGEESGGEEEGGATAAAGVGGVAETGRDAITAVGGPPPPPPPPPPAAEAEDMDITPVLAGPGAASAPVVVAAAPPPPRAEAEEAAFAPPPPPPPPLPPPSAVAAMAAAAAARLARAQPPAISLPAVEAARRAAEATAARLVAARAAAAPPPPLLAPPPPPPPPPEAPNNPVLRAAQAAAAAFTAAARAGSALPTGAELAAARAAAAAAAAAADAAAGGAAGATARPPAPTTFYQTELEINDFAQAARYKVSQKSTIAAIQDGTGAAIIAKGQFFGPGADVPPGQRKMFLLIQGRSEGVVRAAKAACRKVIEEATEKAMRKESGAAGMMVGKNYSAF